MKDENKIVNTGNVKISEDVVVSIVTIAANEVDGVKVTSASALDLAELWGKKGISRGVRVVVEEENADVDICVQMRYGVKIPQTALEGAAEREGRHRVHDRHDRPQDQCDGVRCEL